MKYPAFDGTQSCAEVGVEWFYPESEPYKVNVLRGMCLGCSFIAECRDYAVAHEVDGYWAATTPDERRAIRRGLQRTVSRILVMDYLPRAAS